MKFGVVVFPGSNCDHDCFYAIKDVLGQDVRYIWHKETSLEAVDCIILPGGFSYGDYLRTGSIARFSPVTREVKRHVQRGGLVIGICNGFQILLEMGLLPGAMLRNRNLRFICRYVHIRVENTATPFTNLCRPGQILRIPIAHGEGNYYADPAEREEINRAGRIVFRYCDSSGAITERANPNGSVENIAGICNAKGTVLGMMPHPERACEEALSSSDGRLILESMLRFIKTRESGSPVGCSCKS